MIVMGLCGVLDHSGIIFCIPNLYDTRDHDAHHEKFDVNYAFPFIFMDVLHSTYYRKVSTL
jgi:sterol desaturase/sphingolipid hydroxylase (fatty acid hydroxylase superfamily)